VNVNGGSPALLPFTTKIEILARHLPLSKATNRVSGHTNVVRSSKVPKNENRDARAGPAHPAENLLQKELQAVQRSIARAIGGAR
jgi:hypothetical protein